MSYPALKTARRGHVVVAVSKTEDPRDGFHLYWWQGYITDGACTTLARCDDVLAFGFQGADYDTIGVSSQYFLVTNGVSYRNASIDTTTIAEAQRWIACVDFDDCGANDGYAHMSAVPASVLARGSRLLDSKAWLDAGKLSPQWTARENQRQAHTCGGLCTFTSGWQFAAYHTLENLFTDVASQARGMRPVVHHGDTLPAERSFFVNNYLAPDGKAHLVTWGLKSGVPEFVRSSVEVSPFLIQNWSVVANASMRENFLYGTWNDFGDFTAIRAAGVFFVFEQPFVAFDERIGLAGGPHYSWPGIEANRSANFALVYFRHNAGALGQEVRYSVRDDPGPNPSSAFRPSRLLKPAENVAAPEIPDTVGIAADPFDTSIWMAHFYADHETGRRIVVGKVFGRLLPDLAVYTSAPPLVQARDGVESVRVTAKVVNHGDGRAGPGRVLLYLSREPVIGGSARPLTDMAVDPLGPGEESRIDLVIPVGRDTPPGPYFVLAKVEPADRAEAEYSADNNESPMLGTEEPTWIQSGRR